MYHDSSTSNSYNEYGKTSEFRQKVQVLLGENHPSVPFWVLTVKKVLEIQDTDED